MFSLENFYYILYTNLFKPARIRLYYFYPFGSVKNDHLVNINVDNRYPEMDPGGFKKICLFYDQEPMLKENLNEIVKKEFLQRSFKETKILANSEISDLKNDFCYKFDYLDLYFFFHGFAALIWYRDYKYLPNQDVFTKKFILLNHLTSDDRSYRLFLISELVEKNIHTEGIISLHTTSVNCLKEINSPNTKLSEYAKQSIIKNLLTVNLPIIADTSTPVGSMSANVGMNENALYQNAFLHVVTETVFYYPKLHLTEKIFRPIVNKRPFILVAAPGNLAYLKRYGFKTFDRWIDESYDTELDHDKRIGMIATELEKISNLTINELRDMQNEMADIIEFNFNHFYTDFRRIITQEFLNNFKSLMIQRNSMSYTETFDIDSIDFNYVEKLLLS